VKPNFKIADTAIRCKTCQHTQLKEHKLQQKLHIIEKTSEHMVENTYHNKET